MLEDFETGEKDDKGSRQEVHQLWDPKAIEKVDEYTFRLNGKAAKLAIPEALFHYPFLMMDPAGGGKFRRRLERHGRLRARRARYRPRAGVQGAQGRLLGRRPVGRPLEFIDIGEDPAAAVGALASKQVDMELLGPESPRSPRWRRCRTSRCYQVDTAYTAVARVHPVKPFDDKRVRQALRYAIDSEAVLKVAHRGLGQPGEHHHVAPVHPGICASSAAEA